MAINVQYGDISSALGLALQGGQAVRDRQQAGQDMQFLDLVGNEQARLDANHAREVSQALGVQDKNADLVMQQRRQDESSLHNTAEEDLRGQQIAQQAASDQARLTQTAALNAANHKHADADQQMQVDAFQAKQKAAADKDAAIASLTPEQQAVVKATGRMPYVPNNAGDADANAFKLLESEGRRVEAQIKSYEANRAKDVQAQLHNTPEPANIMLARARLAQINNEVQKRTEGIINHGTLANARIAQQAVQSRQQQPVNGTSPGDAPNGGTPVVDSASEYAALPSGAKYIDAADGKTYIKK